MSVPLDSQEERRVLQALLLPSQGVKWTLGRHWEEGATVVRWLPLVAVPKHETWVGVTETAEWVLGTAKRLTSLEQAQFIPAFPLLLLSRREVIVSMQGVLNQNGLPIEIAERFPASRLVECSLQAKMDYWAEKAVDWVGESELSPSLRAALSNVVDSRWASQHVRQQMKRLLSRSGSS